MLQCLKLYKLLKDFDRKPIKILINKLIYKNYIVMNHTHHEDAAKHHEEAAKHHKAAHAHHTAGNDEKAGNEAYTARSHNAYAMEHAEQAAKKHAEMQPLN